MVRPAPAWLAAAACLLAAFLAMFGPTFWDLMHGIWRTDAQSHGPIVLGVCLWFIWFKSRELMAEPGLALQPATAAGWAALLIGALAYALGRSQALYPLEVGALIPVSLGVVLLVFGADVAKRLWFAFFFMLFMIPLPGSLVDAVTQPLKLGVSWASEQVLYALGYPVSRSGVILGVGPYQLLVADACAGLNSLFTLEALGLLYLNVVRHSSALRNLMLALLIVPISFCANVIRVLVLALVTLHMGDAAGQGFLHDFSGFVLFLSALGLIIGVDSLLRTGVRWRRRLRGGA